MGHSEKRQGEGFRIAHEGGLQPPTTKYPRRGAYANDIHRFPRHGKGTVTWLLRTASKQDRNSLWSMTASAHSSLPLTMFPRVRNAGVQRGSWSFQGRQNGGQTQGTGNGCIQTAHETPARYDYDRRGRACANRGNSGVLLESHSFEALGYAALPLLKCTRGVGTPSLPLQSIRRNRSTTWVSEMQIFHLQKPSLFQPRGRSPW